MTTPLLISGPSGVGKSYLAKYLQLNYRCRRVVPVTTRARRDKEVHGVDYQFLNKEEYQGLVDNNSLFMDNEMLDARYGFSNDSVDRIMGEGLVPVAEIYTPKISQFVKSYPDSKRIFLLPPSEAFLVNRMRQRGDSEETIERRIIEGKKEEKMFTDSYQPLYNKIYRVDNINFKDMVSDIVRNFIPEGIVSKEGNTLYNKFALR